MGSIRTKKEEQRLVYLQREEGRRKKYNGYKNDGGA